MRTTKCNDVIVYNKSSHRNISDFSKIFSKIYPLARKARTSSFPPRDCSLPWFCHGRNTVISFVTKLICYFDIKFSSFICNNSSTESIILISWETIKYQCLATLRSFYLSINNIYHTIAIFGNFWIVSYDHNSSAILVKFAE